MAGVRVTRLIESSLVRMDDPPVRVTRLVASVLCATEPIEPLPEPDIVATETLGRLLDQPEVSLADWQGTQAGELLRHLQDSVELQLYGFLSAEATETLGRLDDQAETALYDWIGVEVTETLGRLEDTVEIAGGRRFGRRPGILADIELAGRTIRVAGLGVRHPTRYYEGKVVSFGLLDRSIPTPAGLPTIGDMRIRIADPDLEFRRGFAAVSPRGKRVTLTLAVLDGGGSLAAGQRVYRGRVESALFPDLAVELEVRDLSFEFFDRDIPTLGTPANFPELEGKAEIFLPILFGVVEAPEGGALACPLVAPSANRYAIARHPVKQVMGVWKREPGTSRETRRDYPTQRLAFTADGFEEVSSGWTVIEQELISDGHTYTVTLLQFASALPEGTEVRVDVEGLPDEDGALIREPVECLRRLLMDFSLGLQYHRDLDYFSFRDEEAGRKPYLCDGAIVSRTTWGQAVGRLVGSFNLDLYQSKHGLLSVRWDREDPAAPVMDDLMRIALGSVEQALTQPVYNRLQYRYDLVPATGEWIGQGRLDNEGDQADLGKVVDREIELPFVREESTAEAVVDDLATYYDLTAYRIRLDLPAPETVDRIELAHRIAVTHWGGLSEVEGGYVAEQFKITGIQFDPGTMRYRVEAIRRLPVPQQLGAELQNVRWETSGLAGPYQGTRAGRLFGVFVFHLADDPAHRRRVVVPYSSDWGRNWRFLDETGFPALDDEIRSYAVYRHGSDVHVVTQEASRRIAYHRFSTTTRRWTVADEEVLAAWTWEWNDQSIHATTTTWTLDIAVRSTGERIVIFSGYEGEDPNYVRRVMVTRNAGSGWTTPVAISRTFGGSGDHLRGALIPGTDDRIHCLYVGWGRDNLSPRGQCLTTLTPNNTVEARCRFLQHSPFGQDGDQIIGQWTTWTDQDGRYWMAAAAGGYGLEYGIAILRWREDRLNAYDTGTDGGGKVTPEFANQRLPVPNQIFAIDTAARPTGALLRIGDREFAFAGERGDAAYQFNVGGHLRWTNQPGQPYTDQYDGSVSPGYPQAQCHVFRSGGEDWLAAFVGEAAGLPKFIMMRLADLPRPRLESRASFEADLFGGG